MITDDNIKENNETFRLVIDPYSLPNGVVVATPDKALITIVDTTKCKLCIVLVAVYLHFNIIVIMSFKMMVVYI